MTEPILSILICTLPDRELQLFHLVSELKNQLDHLEEVEILTDDAVGVSTGSKRQKLLERAKGQYIVFIDDDDEVPPYYVEEILEGAKSGCDCMGMLGVMYTNGANRIEWELSKDLENNTVTRNGSPFYERKTNHISPVRRELALLAGFEDISNGEDKNYSEKLNQYLKTEYKIPHEMYRYMYVTGSKEYLK